MTRFFHEDGIFVNTDGFVLIWLMMIERVDKKEAPVGEHRGFTQIGDLERPPYMRFGVVQIVY